MKVKIRKTESGSFVAQRYYRKNLYKELGLHKDSDFSKIKDGDVVEAKIIVEYITVEGGIKPTSWQFFKIL
jgi:hypothetical protein